MNRWKPILPFYLLLINQSALRADKTDDYVEAQRKEQRIPGLSLAVVKEGKILKARGYGLANVEHDVPAKPETIYQSGSLGKQFTAAAILMLIQEGRMGLDDKVSKYLDGTPATWKEMTVRHLLTHTAGVKNYGPRGLDYRKDYTEKEFLAKAISMPLDFPPGQKWRYSNTGYQVLGIVIGKVAGKFYGDLLRQRIFIPLGMETARIISEEDIVVNRAAGYHMVRGQLKNQEWVSPSINTTADGSIYLTVLDLARWDAGLYADKILSNESRQQMWTPVKTQDGKSHPYGFGWSLGELGRHKFVRHGGAWQGFTAEILRFTDDKLTVIVLTNLAGARPDKISEGVAGCYLRNLTPRK